MQHASRIALFGYRRKAVAAFLKDLASNNATEFSASEGRLAVLRARLDDQERRRRALELHLSSAREEYRALVSTLREVQSHAKAGVVLTRQAHEQEEGKRLVALAHRQGALGERQRWLAEARGELPAIIERCGCLLDSAGAAQPTPAARAEEVFRLPDLRRAAISAPSSFDGA